MPDATVGSAGADDAAMKERHREKSYAYTSVRGSLTLTQRSQELGFSGQKPIPNKELSRLPRGGLSGL